MIPTNDAEFLIAARTIANTFCDRLARMAMPPEQVADLCAVALAEIIAQQVGPMGAVERLRDAADVLERQLLDSAN